MRLNVFIATLLVSISFVAAAHAAALRTVALTGQSAPGTAGGITFETFGSFIHPQDQYIYGGPVLNDAGQIAFRADLTGSGVDSTNYQGVWSEGSGTLSLVARTGSQAPGAVSGVNFSTDPALELFFPCSMTLARPRFTVRSQTAAWDSGRRVPAALRPWPSAGNMRQVLPAASTLPSTIFTSTSMRLC
jgi:hypothetical protein